MLLFEVVVQDRAGVVCDALIWSCHFRGDRIMIPKMYDTSTESSRQGTSDSSPNDKPFHLSKAYSRTLLCIEPECPNT